MTEKSNIITNRDRIKKWTEEREHIPTKIGNAAGKDKSTGILRIHFLDHDKVS